MKQSFVTGILCCVAILAGWPALAQDRLMEIEPSNMQPSVQTGRPMPSWWDVKIKGSALVEGRLEFQLYNYETGKLLQTITTEDLALSGPQQRIRVLLPPVVDQMPIEQIKVHVKFFGKRFNQDLGAKNILHVANPKARTFMALQSISRLAPKKSKDRDPIVRRLAFESLATNLDESVKTVFLPLDPNDLPQESISYCAYELVVLFGEEFRLMKKPQLDALIAWVRAGGSLYLEPMGVLEPYHVEFLRNITKFGPSDMVIQPDSHGRLIPGTIWNDERLFKLTNGLGRVVLRVEEEREVDLETPAWRAANAFLWRLHSDQARQVSRDAVTGINALLPAASQAPDPFGGGFSMNNMMTGRRLSLKMPASTEELVDWLMPEGVRMVPLWVLGLILVSFVVWIGPVDYFGLGRLNARKFTWITFPAATFLVTGLTVWITNQYMSSAETRRGMVIRDVGDDGSIVRTNRFELLFIASTRQVTTDVRKGVFSPMATGQMISDDPYQQAIYQQQQMYGRRAGMMRGESANHPPARMTGRVPTEFTVTQDVAKWTPQLNRMFSIPGAQDETQIDWQALMEGISVQDMFISHSIASDLDARIQKQFGHKALVACLGHQGRWAISRNTSWEISGRSQQSPYPTSPYSPYTVYDEYGWQNLLPQDIRSQPVLVRWLYQNSVALPYGLFSLTSQVGPAGSADLDDLPILDGSDPGLALLIVVVPRGDDFIVYRKLLRSEK